MTMTDRDEVIIEMTKVTINMPVTLHAELRERANKRGITVTELMRRAVALDKRIYEAHDTGAEVVIKHPSGKETELFVY